MNKKEFDEKFYQVRDTVLSKYTDENFKQFQEDFSNTSGVTDPLSFLAHFSRVYAEDLNYNLFQEFLNVEKD